MTWLRKVLSFRQVNRLIHVGSRFNTSVRVRFAPSPTGNLHVGGLRTALYNYLFAKSHDGVFILRIEDTDQTRLVEGAVKSIEDDLRWAGLNLDEGPSQGGSYGPYYQSQRLKLYQKEADKLVEEGHAYRCFCTERRLDLLRKDAGRRRERPKYDNRCRHLSKEAVEEKLAAGTAYCIRFKLTPYLEPFHDLVYGSIYNNIAEAEGDPVIMKSDGYPTYHLANVVDDHYMEISHVLRGVEWQPSTTKHLLMFKAFNWKPPQYAHIPLLLNEDGKKLSKRHGDLSVSAFRKQHIYPQALTNFLLICGGGFLQKANPDVTKELENINNLCNHFTLSAINVNSCVLPLKRLNDYNRIELKRKADDECNFNEIVRTAKELILNIFPESKGNLTDERLQQVLKWSIDNGRISNLHELIGVQFSFLWIQQVEFDVNQYDSKFFDLLPLILSHYENANNLEQSEISNYLKSLASEKQLHFGKFMKFLRACISGLKDGPGISEMFVQLGKTQVLRRLRQAYQMSCNKNKEKAIS